MSLLEVGVVVAILGWLVGTATVSVRNYQARARQDVARKDIESIVKALEAFRAMNSRFPTCQEGLGILERPRTSQSGPLLRGDAVDPWGRPYRYDAPPAANRCKVICFGADGQAGGRGGDEDITSGDLGD